MAKHLTGILSWKRGKISVKIKFYCVRVCLMIEG